MAQTPEALVFRRNFTDIANLVSTQQEGPAWLADELVAGNFTSSADVVAIRGLTPYEMVSRMLRPVEYKLQASYCDTLSEFFKFVKILEKRPAYHVLAQHLMDEYKKNGGTGTPWSHQPVAQTADTRSPPGDSQTDSCSGARGDNCASNDDGKLKFSDHVSITNYLLSLDATAVHQLGIVFGLSHTKLTKMKDKSQMFLDDVITAWLREEDSVTQNCPPRWENLVKALHHPRLAQTGIATKIENERLKKGS